VRPRNRLPERNFHEQIQAELRQREQHVPRVRATGQKFVRFHQRQRLQRLRDWTSARDGYLGFAGDRVFTLAQANAHRFET